MRIALRNVFVPILLLLMANIAPAVTPATWRSHPPLRPLAQPSHRPLASGPARFVDAAHGKDSGNGSKARPWKTVNHALAQLAPGDTLYLRGGTYYENIYCAVAGTQEKPITIRSYPGELAIVDGGIADFFSKPQSSWERAPGGAPGEYRSTKTYKNIRDVVGLFGDSLIGLQTYWYRMDLQATNEKWVPNAETFIDPIYCGPGLWYDKGTGRIHARLAHTTLRAPEGSGSQFTPYKGETDPRKLPLVIAPFDSVPLMVDQAMYVRFQDLVIRGGGQATVRLNCGIDIEFDRCTIYAANTGISAKGTGPLKMTNCGVFGMIAPWMFRSENVLYSYSPTAYPPFLLPTNKPGEKPAPVARHISRLPTHALLTTDGGYEFETFYYPMNHHWDISHCEFTDGHDGIYPSGREIRFHHNLIDNMQDDAVYISSPTPYVSDGVYVYENLIRQCITGFGAHARGGPDGKIYLYRNIVDMRAPVPFNRPTREKPEGQFEVGASAFQVHDVSHIIHMEDIYLYQNTTLTRANHPFGGYCGGMAFGTFPTAERRVFNNLCVYTGGIKQYPVAYGYDTKAANLVFDGNLHWYADPAVKPPANYFETSRKHPLSEANKKFYPEGWDAHSLATDPKFLFYQNAPQNVDLRLQDDSPAKNAGVALPTEWPDPLRKEKGSTPDIGALPAGSSALKVGIDGRITAGDWR